MNLMLSNIKLLYLVLVWQRVIVLMLSQALKTRSRVTGRQVWCALCPGLWTRFAQRAMLQVRIKHLQDVIDILGKHKDKWNGQHKIKYIAERIASGQPPHYHMIKSLQLIQ